MLVSQSVNQLKSVRLSKKSVCCQWIYNVSISDPRLKQLGEEKVAEWRKWFDTRLDDAIEAAATQENSPVEGNFLSQPLSQK